MTYPTSHFWISKKKCTCIVQCRLITWRLVIIANSCCWQYHQCFFERVSNDFQVFGIQRVLARYYINNSSNIALGSSPMAVYSHWFSQQHHRLWPQPAVATCATALVLYNNEKEDVVTDECPANVVSKCHKRPPPIIKEVPKRPRRLLLQQPQQNLLNLYDLVNNNGMNLDWKYFSFSSSRFGKVPAYLVHFLSCGKKGLKCKKC